MATSNHSGGIGEREYATINIPGGGLPYKTDGNAFI